jgi:integrase/recombinase XerD
MSVQSNNAQLFEELSSRLKIERYCAQVRRSYLRTARRFIDCVERRGLAIEAVGPSELEEFLRRELRAFRKRNGRSPRNRGNWRKLCVAAIHMVLRLVQGEEAMSATPTTALEFCHRELVQGYDGWLRELRGLASATRLKRTTQAMHFLTELGPRADRETIAQLGVADIDLYLQQRCSGRRRGGIEDITGGVRDFLRYLHGSGRTVVDLSSTVRGPRIYEHEDIPSALDPEDVRKVLAVTREDRSPLGRRDYAILMLLATYGLRAGEIAQLRLEDIDWQGETIHVRHSKTGAYSELPLLRAPGEALLDYLRHARPKSVHREVFLLARAPYRPFKNRGGVGGVTRARLRAAQVTSMGKKGAHAFRHARAVSLLRASMSLKTIGDILGHRSAASAMAYLKLATNDLRAVGLDLPAGVSL